MSGPDSPDSSVAPRVSHLPPMEHTVVEHGFPHPSPSLPENADPANLPLGGSCHLGSTQSTEPRNEEQSSAPSASVAASPTTTISTSSRLPLGDDVNHEVNPGPPSGIYSGVPSATNLSAQSYADVMRTDAVGIIRVPGPAEFDRDVLDVLSDETGSFK
ncbi:unnamed protein product [Parascedosporium putredinis]|uniref:Uncharacterized protein n=1 Tax=Parascedosporium putredinis TaxID=1442378 RepID=A0A9P1H699_9PEZI|nr:unnamed protein product [Parascedosporium putredinis]CAI7997425.1 unnamed protein product [Parascedosporium putredinis]